MLEDERQVGASRREEVDVTAPARTARSELDRPEVGAAPGRCPSGGRGRTGPRSGRGTRGSAAREPRPGDARRSCRDRARPVGAGRKALEKPGELTGGRRTFLTGASSARIAPARSAAGTSSASDSSSSSRAWGARCRASRSQSPAGDRVPVSVATTDVPKRGASSRQRTRKSRFARLRRVVGRDEVPVPASATIEIPASSSSRDDGSTDSGCSRHRSSSGPPS